jgi:hypothetical protein
VSDHDPAPRTTDQRREALIQHICRRGDHTEFLLLLDDGAPSCARLEHFEAEWLELRVGDIVPADLLGPLPCARATFASPVLISA